MQPGRDETSAAARLEKELARAAEAREFDGDWTPAVEEKALDAVAGALAEEERAEEARPPGPPPAAGLPAERVRSFVLGDLTLGELLGIRPAEAFSLAEFGHNCLEHGELAQAQAIFEALVTLSPREASFHTCLAAAYHRQGKAAEAIEEYGAALALDRKDLDALVNRAELHLEAGRPDLALPDLEAAIALDPKGASQKAQRARGLATVVASIASSAKKP